MTAWSPKNCRSHWDQLDLHQEVVNQHSRSDLRMSSPSLHHQFQLHQPHGSSCRQTDRPTDMSIIAPTHVHLFSNWSGKPIYIKHSSLKTFDKIIIQIPEIWKIVVPCNVKEIYLRKIKNKKSYVAVLYAEVRATFQIGIFVLHGHLCCSGSTIKCQWMSNIILK